MRHRTLASWVMGVFGVVALSAAIAHAAPEDSAPATAPSQPIITSTRQHAFTIPFRIEPAESPALQPVEVQLHVSTNQGTSWELSTRVKPDKGSFVFRSPRDGEYWFSIRTVDKQGTARPEGPLEAQLKVIVDTVAPRLDLTATRGSSGEIVAQWKAVDPHLKQGSFKLEYQADSSGLWERVAVDSPPSAMRHTVSGEATWMAKANGSITVRAEITDLAGNPATAQAVVKIDGPPYDGGLAGSPSNAAGGAGGQAWRSENVAGNPAQWPADRSTVDPLGRVNNSNSGPSGMARTDSPRSDGRVSALPVSQSTAGGPPGSPLDFSVLPRGQRPRMVNSRSFELEYEIDAVGPSGIGKVELWGTRDGGRTWTSYAVDRDNRSPIQARIDAEGIYGFRIVVQSGSGLGGRPPVAGDLPDIWIGVDLTRPQARITQAEVAPDTGELVIRWEASDEVADARPISLFFSTNLGGPWTPIASGLDNTGIYRWRLDNRVPDRIYLRLEMRDEAGNVGTFDTPEPVPLDRHRPEGRIRGVRPVEENDRSAQRPN